MDRKRVINEDTFDLKYVDKQLRAMRAWFDGFRGGGGMYPHDVDVLRKVQVLLSSSRPLKTHQDTVADAQQALDRLQQVEAAIAEAEKRLRLLYADLGVLTESISEVTGTVGFDGEQREKHDA